MGFVLPVLFNSWCWRPPLAGAAAGEAATSSGVRQRLGRTIAACNRSLYQLLGGTADSTIGRVGIAYFIFGTAWLLSKDLASKEWGLVVVLACNLLPLDRGEGKGGRWERCGSGSGRDGGGTVFLRLL